MNAIATQNDLGGKGKMGTTPQKDGEFCPYWEKDAKKCKICNTGLFIPLDDHIEVYCKTQNYPQCLQYSLNQGNHLEIQGKTKGQGKNRRQHMRVPSRNQVTLVKLINTNKVVNHRTTMAETIDLSRGGMRLNLDTPLPHDTVIQFAFDDNFPSTFHNAMGQIEWCNKQIDEPGYQVGVSFKEDRLVRAMDHFLGTNFRTS